jgi:hypothetical protein
MYAIVSHHDKKYKPLGDVTWDKNKLVYAKRHGYAAHCRTENFVTSNVNPMAGQHGSMTGFEKIYYIKEILESHPEYKWVWWTGTDSMITNMNVRIEDRISNNYHFMIATDVNGINADSWLIRNSPEGHEFLNDILSLESECVKFWDMEQRAIALTLGLPITGEAAWINHKKGNLTICDKWRDKVKIVPQKYLNAYIYQLYGSQYPDPRDRLAVNGNWSYGDWLVHWPGSSFEVRLDLAKQFENVIVY